MNKQRTFASVAWSAKGKVTRRERFVAEMDAVIPLSGSGGKNRPCGLLREANHRPPAPFFPDRPHFHLNSPWRCDLCRASLAVGILLLLLSVAVNGRGATSWATWEWSKIRPLRVRVLDWSQPQFLAGWVREH